MPERGSDLLRTAAVPRPVLTTTTVPLRTVLWSRDEGLPTAYKVPQLGAIDGTKMKEAVSDSQTSTTETTNNQRAGTTKYHLAQDMSFQALFSFKKPVGSWWNRWSDGVYGVRKVVEFLETSLRCLQSSFNTALPLRSLVGPLPCPAGGMSLGASRGFNVASFDGSVTHILESPRLGDRAEYGVRLVE